MRKIKLILVLVLVTIFIVNSNNNDLYASTEVNNELVSLNNNDSIPIIRVPFAASSGVAFRVGAWSIGMSSYMNTLSGSQPGPVAKLKIRSVKGDLYAQDFTKFD